MSGKRQSDAAQFNSSHAAKKKNRQTGKFSIKSMMATVEVCGCQTIPSRGHRDDAKYLHGVASIPGNFQVLL